MTFQRRGKGSWKKLDKLLEEPVRLDCIGGFAAVMGYGLPRATNDLDYRTLDPYNRINDLQRIAGPASALAKEYGVHRTTISKIKMGTYHDKYRN